MPASRDITLLSAESNGDSEMHPLQWAATRGVVARTVYGPAAACPYAAGSLGALCWRYGLTLRETGRSVSRETTGNKRGRQPRWSAEDRTALVKLLAAGFKHGEIAVILGRSYEGVEGQLKSLRATAAPATGAGRCDGGAA
jgi:hypothetical protein